MSTSRLLIPRFNRGRPTLSQAEVFDLLSNQRRRAIIRYLRNHDGSSITLDDLIDAVVEWEHGVGAGSITDGQRASVYSSLIQTHLPRLEAAGVVEVDDASGEITTTDLTREMELYLEYSPRSDIPWAEYYVGLSAVSAALIAVVWADLPPFGLLSEVSVAAIIVCFVFISAIVHLFQMRRSRLGHPSFEGKLDPERTG